MDANHLRELASAYLQPLFSGATIKPDSAPSSLGSQLVALASPCEIQFKLEKSDTYRLRLVRSQPFEKRSASGLTELHIVESFVNVVSGMKEGLSASYKDDLRGAIQRRVVARALRSGAANEGLIAMIIDRLSNWGGQLYEGKPIAAALGVTGKPNPIGVPLEEYCREPFSAVLSNGHDSIVACDPQARVVDYESAPVIPSASPFAPLGVSFVAEWTKSKEVALVLNRSGELLALKNGELLFTRRGGQWHYLSHSPVLRQMGNYGKPALREAVYSTCLDTSFARSGGCVGIVASSHASVWQQAAVSPKDYLRSPLSTRSRALNLMIGGRHFHQLDRRLRQELVAIDGATILSHRGEILAAGAILKIPGGSTGGGRLAAALTLAKYGVGIKISQDGRITGFRGDPAEERFRVM